MIKHAQSAQKDLVLGSGPLKLIFGIRSERLALVEASGADGRNRLAEPVAGESLWQLTLRDPSGTVKKIASGEAAPSEVIAGAGRATFRWNIPLGEKPVRVEMRVRVRKGDPLSYWSLQVTPPKGWRLQEIAFPTIANVRLEEGMKMAVPWCNGVEYNLEPGMAYGEAYPCMLVSMQFLALYHAGRGFYVGAHDAQAGSKEILAKSTLGRVEVTIKPWLEIRPQPGGMYRVPYEAAVGVFHGDWYEAAQLYRKFALQAPWCQVGSVSRRPIPQWLKDVDLWLTCDATNFNKDLAACQKAWDYFGTKSAIHWYNWYERPASEGSMPGYPLFTARPGFVEALQKAQGIGYRVMPYMDGRLWNIHATSWGQEQAEELAARKENGELYQEYGVCAAMCPHVPRWHETVARVAERLVNEYGADGAYVDEVGAARPIRCFNPDHGHPLGGGPWWTAGYRQMANVIPKNLPEEACVTTEHTADCYLDSFDASCSVNNPRVPPKAGRVIPLFTAVYAGYYLPFGFRPDDCTEAGFAHPLSFRQNQTDAFLTGAQVGWVHVRILMKPESAKEAEFLKNLAQCRQYGHPYLVHGTFLGLMDVGGDNPRLTAEVTLPGWLQWVPEWAPYPHAPTYPIDMPAVQASAWLGKDSSLGIALVNASDADRAVWLQLPLEKAGLGAARELTLRTFGPQGLISSTQWSGTVLNVTVPAGECRILALSRRAPGSLRGGGS